MPAVEMSALSKMLVDDLLAREPRAMRAFNRLKMACPGCAMAPFMMVGEACASYGVPLASLSAALDAVGALNNVVIEKESGR